MNGCTFPVVCFPECPLSSPVVLPMPALTVPSDPERAANDKAETPHPA
jgi:hypothetical protein